MDGRGHAEGMVVPVEELDVVRPSQVRDFVALFHVAEADAFKQDDDERQAHHIHFPLSLARWHGS